MRAVTPHTLCLPPLYTGRLNPRPPNSGLDLNGRNKFLKTYYTDLATLAVEATYQEYQVCFPEPELGIAVIGGVR